MRLILVSVGGWRGGFYHFGAYLNEICFNLIQEGFIYKFYLIKRNILVIGHCA